MEHEQQQQQQQQQLEKKKGRPAGNRKRTNQKRGKAVEEEKTFVDMTILAKVLEKTIKSTVLGTLLELMAKDDKKNQQQQQKQRKPHHPSSADKVLKKSDVVAEQSRPYTWTNTLADAIAVPIKKPRKPVNRKVSGVSGGVGGKSQKQQQQQQQMVVEKEFAEQTPAEMLGLTLSSSEEAKPQQIPVIQSGWVQLQPTPNLQASSVAETSAPPSYELSFLTQNYSGYN